MDLFTLQRLVSSLPSDNGGKVNFKQTIAAVSALIKQAFQRQFPPLVEDRPLHDEIAQISQLLKVHAMSVLD